MDIDISKVSERLNLEEDILRSAIERRVISLCKYRDIRYIVFKKKVRHVERGTVLFLNENMDVVMGYPKIRRALVLDPTVKKYFVDKVVVEEKLNGYNVRVVKIDGNVLGITRGGRVCPFTTKKLLKLLDTKILKDYPGITLCGEMVGLNNPYVSHYYPEVDREICEGIRENLGLFIFDIREGSNSLPVEKRIELLEAYRVPHVKPLGVFKKEEVEEIKSIVLKLDREGREGIVMKDPDMLVDPIKYTTHYTHCQDLSVAFRYTFDLGIHFMFSRLVREGYQSYEFKEGEEELEKRAHSIGRSIIYSMVESIWKVARGELITEDFELYFENEEDLEEFLKYLKEVHISYVLKEKEVLKNSIFRVVIGKVYPSTRDKIKSYLEGSLW